MMDIFMKMRVVKKKEMNDGGIDQDRNDMDEKSDNKDHDNVNNSNSTIHQHYDGNDDDDGSESITVESIIGDIRERIRRDWKRDKSDQASSEMNEEYELDEMEDIYDQVHEAENSIITNSEKKQTNINHNTNNTNNTNTNNNINTNININTNNNKTNTNNNRRENNKSNEASYSALKQNLLNIMEEHPVKLHPKTLSILIHELRHTAHCDFDHMITMYSVLMHTDYSPNVHSWKILLTNFHEKKLYEDVIKIYEKAKALKIDRKIYRADGLLFSLFF